MEHDSASLRSTGAGRAIAVVSGKGGSGKTMIAAEAAVLLSEDTTMSAPLILIDGDTGTAGLSYYMGLKQVRSIRGGFSNFALSSADRPPVESLLRPVQLEATGNRDRDGNLLFLPIGDHRRISRSLGRPVDGFSSSSKDYVHFGILLAEMVDRAKRLDPGMVIVDCRGGIDEESLAICSAVDDILLVIEPDTTSFEASRHLVETLSDLDLDHKLVGFIINKAFSDPSVVARSGTSVFGTQFLGAIPFDPETTREFLVGNIPRPKSTFSTSLRYALGRAYPDRESLVDVIAPPPIDYDRITLRGTESARGGGLIGLYALGFAIVVLLNLLGAIGSSSLSLVAIVGVIILTALGAVEGPRRTVGRFMNQLLARSGRNIE